LALNKILPGMGLGRVPQTWPVPIPTRPIPGYPHGFTNLCYALDPKHSSTPHPDEIDISLPIAAVVPSKTVPFSLGNGSFLTDEVGPLSVQHFLGIWPRSGGLDQCLCICGFAFSFGTATASDCRRPSKLHFIPFTLKDYSHYFFLTYLATCKTLDSV